MKALLLSLAVLLTGCQAVPVKQQAWPEPPGRQSTEPCPNLQKLEEGATLSTVSKTITVNYTEYYMCAVKVDAWQQWYQMQKIIREGLNK